MPRLIRSTRRLCAHVMPAAYFVRYATSQLNTVNFAWPGLVYWMQHVHVLSRSFSQVKNWVTWRRYRSKFTMSLREEDRPAPQFVRNGVLSPRISPMTRV